MFNNEELICNIPLNDFMVFLRLPHAPISEMVSARAKVQPNEFRTLSYGVTANQRIYFELNSTPSYQTQKLIASIEKYQSKIGYSRIMEFIDISVPYSTVDENQAIIKEAVQIVTAWNKAKRFRNGKR